MYILRVHQPQCRTVKKNSKRWIKASGIHRTKATREKKLQAAAMQAEFTLHDTLIILSYLSRDTDPEISSQARKNLIPAARNWFNRPDRPELPEPIRDIVLKVIEKVGLGEKAETGALPAKLWEEISAARAGRVAPGHRSQ